MLLVENIDDRDFLKALFEAMYPEPTRNENTEEINMMLCIAAAPCKAE